MKVDFLRFKATDGVELQGWLTESPGEVAVIHVHGMSGNGYENYFLDVLRESYNHSGRSFFSFDNRGKGIISSFRSQGGTKKGGSCFEIFEESSHDIQGAIDLIKSRGKSRIVLQGHSLGGSKVVNYLLSTNEKGVIGAILLAPTDMVGWANTDPRHQAYLDKAHDLINQGRFEELVGAECWLDKTPLSAQTYPTICEVNTAVDIYTPREEGTRVGEVKIPMAIIYGDKDIGIEKVDGNIDSWKRKVSKVTNPKTSIQVIHGADHGFVHFEDKLAETVLQNLRTWRGNTNKLSNL